MPSSSSPLAAIGMRATRIYIAIRALEARRADVSAVNIHLDFLRRSPTREESRFIFYPYFSSLCVPSSLRTRTFQSASKSWLSLESARLQRGARHALIYEYGTVFTSGVTGIPQFWSRLFTCIGKCYFVRLLFRVPIGKMETIRN